MMERIGSTLLFGGWLMVEKPGLAGIPPRGLPGFMVGGARPAAAERDECPPRAAIEFRRIPSP